MGLVMRPLVLFKMVVTFGDDGYGFGGQTQPRLIIFRRILGLFKKNVSMNSWTAC